MATNTSKQKIYESGEVPEAKVWDTVKEAREAGFSRFTFEIVYPIAANNPPFVIIRGDHGTIPSATS